MGFGMTDDQTKTEAPLKRGTIAKKNFSCKFYMGLPVVYNSKINKTVFLWTQLEYKDQSWSCGRRNMWDEDI
jgi:hypothetical protein